MLASEFKYESKSENSKKCKSRVWSSWKSGKKYCGKFVVKICSLATVTWNLSFGLSSWGLCSRVDFFFSCFRSGCCFKMPKKFKCVGNIERISRIYFRGFLVLVNGPKSSILNWVSNLNFQNNFFPLFKDLSFLLVSSVTGKNQI